MWPAVGRISRPASSDDLQWLGISWETPVRQQSQHFDDYRAAADRLLAADLLYPCYASRSEILAVANQRRCDPDGVPLYPGWQHCISPAETERRRRRSEPFALRINMRLALATARELRDA
jgi:glutamyl-Q tRNA(Asp) synthetase